MDRERLLIVGEVPGFTPQIGRLVCMMNFARWTTIQTVQGLTRDELDHLHDAESNSIGALLAHLGGVETAYQAITFESRELDEREQAKWGAALELGERGRQEIRGEELAHYLDLLDTVRQRTLAGFAERDDAWLAEEHGSWNDLPVNHHFMWFHVFEDEINHRGQMRWLRKRLPG